MASAAQETLDAIKKALEPYTRPREEVEYIRKVLALNLLSSHENGPRDGPLALSDPDCSVNLTSDVCGLHRMYLEALHRNVQAQRDYSDAVSRQQAAREGERAGPRTLNNADRLEDHVTGIELRRKQQRLQIVKKYLDILGQKPVVSPGFLQPHEIFKDAPRPPQVPQTVISGFTTSKHCSKTDLRSLADRLEKAVIRCKLLMKNEERLLDELSSHSMPSPGDVSDVAKFAALSATRKELIGWIETELGTAPAAQGSQFGEGGKRNQDRASKLVIDEQLALIKKKYANYVAARKALIQLVGQTPTSSIKPPEGMETRLLSKSVPTASTTHLIIPYVENLLAIAQEQKAAISHKTHLSNVLAKQTEETIRALHRLREESLLLPAHSEVVKWRWTKGLGIDMPMKDGREITDCVQPWISAADSAKLASLEAVAEKVEEGQFAIEASMKILFEIDQLLGRDEKQGDNKSTDEDITGDDIWLAESATLGKGSRSHAHDRTMSDAINKKDIWSMLDSSLGLINGEDSSRR